MDIDLTSDEITYAKKRVDNYDRFTRTWVYLRIFLLILAFLFMIIGGLWIWLLGDLNSQEEIFTQNTTFESMRYESVKRYIDDKSDYNSVQNKAVFSGIFSFIPGAFLLLTVIARWNSHKYEPFDVKVYRTLLGKNENH